MVQLSDDQLQVLERTSYLHRKLNVWKSSLGSIPGRLLENGLREKGTAHQPSACPDILPAGIAAQGAQSSGPPTLMF